MVSSDVESASQIRVLRISDNRIGSLRRNTTDEVGSPVRARDMVLKGMTTSRSRRTMVGYLTVLPNAMGGQGSMSCGTSKSEAYCQQSESPLKATRGASDTCRKNFTHGNIRERFALYRCETYNRSSDS